MYRIESCRGPDGELYLRVELPMLSEPLLDIFESVTHAMVRATNPQKRLFYWVVRSGSGPPTAEPEPAQKTEKPQGGHPGAQEPTHLSTVKGDNDEHGS